MMVMAMVVVVVVVMVMVMVVVVVMVVKRRRGRRRTVSVADAHHYYTCRRTRRCASTSPSWWSGPLGASRSTAAAGLWERTALESWSSMR